MADYLSDNSPATSPGSHTSYEEEDVGDEWDEWDELAAEILGTSYSHTEHRPGAVVGLGGSLGGGGAGGEGFGVDVGSSAEFYTTTTSTTITSATTTCEAVQSFEESPDGFPVMSPMHFDAGAIDFNAATTNDSTDLLNPSSSSGTTATNGIKIVPPGLKAPISFDYRGVKLKLLRKLRDFAKDDKLTQNKRPAPFERQKDGSWSNKGRWSIGAVINVLLGSHELVESNCRWNLKADGTQPIDPRNTLTGLHRGSLIDVLKAFHFDGDENKHPDLGVTYQEVVCDRKPELFVSFANQGSFTNMVDAVEQYMKENEMDEESTYLWFGPVVTSQWNIPVKDVTWFTTTFRNAIAEIGHTVVVMTPWENPHFLNRLWGLWELYCTLDASLEGQKYIKFGIAMPPYEKESFQKAVMTKFESVYRPYKNIDVAKATCWDPKERDSVKAAIEASPNSYHGINTRIFDGLRQWMMFTMDRTLMKYRRKCEEALVELEKENVDKAVVDRSNETIEILCNVLHSLSTLCHAQGDYTRSLSLEEECAKKRKDLLGISHPDTISSMSNLASINKSKGDVDKAIALEEACWKLHKESQGEKHPDTLAYLGNMAAYYGSKGDLPMAIALEEDCYMKRREVFGDNHPETIKSVNNLSDLYGSAGDFDKSVKLLQVCFEQSKEVLGESHPGTLLSMNKLATMYKSKGDFDNAILLELNFFHNLKALVGDSHPKTLYSMFTLATLYKSKGNVDKAIELGEICYLKRKRVLGDTNVETLRSMSNLASCLEQKGTMSNIPSEQKALHDRAIKLEEECWEKRKQSLGENHQSALASQAHLALMYSNHDRISEALPLAEDALEKQRKLFGDDNSDTLTSLSNLSSMYYNSKEIDTALQIGRECYEKRKAALGEDNLDTIASMSNLAYYYSAKNENDKSISLGEECLKLFRKVKGDTDNETLITMSNLATVCRANGDMNRAVTLAKECYEARKKQLGDLHHDTLKCLSNLTLYYEQRGDYNKAIALEEESWNKLKRELGESNPKTLNSEMILSLYYKNKGDINRAYELAEDCLEKSRKALGENHPDTRSATDVYNAISAKYNERNAYNNGHNSNATKLRLKKKLEEKKRQNEALQITNGPGSSSSSSSGGVATPPAPPAMSEEELLDLFKNDKPKKKGGKK